MLKNEMCWHDWRWDNEQKLEINNIWNIFITENVWLWLQDLETKKMVLPLTEMEVIGKNEKGNGWAAIANFKWKQNYKAEWSGDQEEGPG